MNGRTCMRLWSERNRRRGDNTSTAVGRGRVATHVSCIILESRGRAKLKQTELPFHLCNIILLFHRGHGWNGCRCSEQRPWSHVLCDYIRTARVLCWFTRAIERRVEAMRFNLVMWSLCQSMVWALPGAGRWHNFPPRAQADSQLCL